VVARLFPNDLECEHGALSMIISVDEPMRMSPGGHATAQARKLLSDVDSCRAPHFFKQPWTVDRGVTRTVELRLRSQLEYSIH